MNCREENKDGKENKTKRETRLLSLMVFNCGNVSVEVVGFTRSVFVGF